MQSDVQLLGTQVNLLWVVIGAAMVIFMQAGFALVETGFTRAKHAAHVMSTNFAIFGLGFVGFFLVGFPLAFGGFSTSLIGMDQVAESRQLFSASSCTWWRSWTLLQQFPPAPWPSVGSGAASQSGASSVAPSITHCSQRGHGVAAGSQRHGTP